MDKWDERYLRLAKEVASWSKDPSTKVGAIAVLDGSVLAQGYNGFPKYIQDDEAKLNDREIKYQYTVHAEMNCIYNAARNGCSLFGSTMYIYPLPACHECAKGIIQCGVERVVSPVFENEFTQKRWEKSCSTTFNMFEEAGIEYDLIKGFTNV